MLVIFLILGAASFCNGKAFPEGSPVPRGKRVYDHGQYTDKDGQSFYPTYEDYWKQRGFYYPSIDGQPIYIPAINNPEKIMNEYIDHYYRDKPTEVPVLQNADPYKYYYESATDSSSVLSSFGEANVNHYRNYHMVPEAKHDRMKYQQYDTYPEGNDYTPEMVDKVKMNDYGNNAYTPEMVDKVKMNDYGNNAYTPEIVDKVKMNGYENNAYSQREQSLKNEDDKYEEPVTYKLYEPDQIPKQEDKHVAPKISTVSDYDLPTILETVKQKNGMPRSTLSPSYDLQNHGTLRKSKGKRKKQYHTLKRQEANKEFVLPNEDIDHVFEVKGIESLDEFHKDKTGTDDEYSFDKPKVFVTKKSGQKIVQTKDPVTKTESKEYEDQHIAEKNYDLYANTKEKVVEVNEYEPPVVVKTDPKEHPVKTKEKVVVKTDPKEHPVKTKEKVIVKTDPKEHPVKTKEKVVVKTDPKEPPIKTKEKVVKINPKPPVKTKEKVIIKPNKHPVKTEEKVVVKEPEIKKDKVVAKEKTTVVKPESEEYPVKNDKIRSESVNDDYQSMSEKDGKLTVDLEVLENESTDLENESFFTNDFLDTENESAEVDEHESNSDLLDEELEENLQNSGDVGNAEIVSNESQLESKINSESEHSESRNSANLQRFLPSDAVQKLSSLNSNIWSLVFNPNAQALNLKKCITRNNETGYCTYVQHCEVPNLVTSLEQLLNNACVMDDIFIGVCCPEFPVETVKVHWDQPPSGSEKRTEDEFGHSAEDCGIRSNEASKLQSWPWKAPLISMSNGKIFCGGVLINEEYVLTAAHCTTKIPRNQILVRLGQFDDSSGDDFAVVEIKRHAQYNPRTLNNDIALLKLARRIGQNDHTGVICLPEDIDEDAENDHVGDKATLLGWRGMFGTNAKDPESLEIMSNEECAKKLGMKVLDSLLCTDARNENERTCNADSGAPLVVEDGGKYEVIGILSWNRNDCDQRFPSTFSRVSSYVGWIQKHLT